MSFLDAWIGWLLAVGVGVLTVTWIVELGALRGILAGLCRVGWILPVVLAFQPRTLSEKLPRSMSLKPIHVLLDDSASMRQVGSDGESLAQAQANVQMMERECLRLGCQVKLDYVSNLDAQTQAGFSPLNEVLEPWLFRNGAEPWVFLSDGGDWRPKLPWSPRLRGAGATGEGDTARGFIGGFRNANEANIWIEEMEVPPFSFEGKPFEVSVTMRRNTAAMYSAELVQVQVNQDDKSLANANVRFADGEAAAQVSIPLPALSRGQHLLSLKALPTPAERSLWDNQSFASLEVLPNTIGILHLLGSPSWDGRFLRRYLKGEPKYDLISFFILRDRWDSQAVSERDLSLIPFPVERLFNEELPNFKVVIIQNFALFEFLQPEFQKNLVEFVKAGGGLLFMGGPRALQDGDLRGSPLEEILPFHTEQMAAADDGQSFGFSGGFRPTKKNLSGPYYDSEQQFRISFARPDQNQRELASVYDDWESMASELTDFAQAKGLHRMDKVKFKAGGHTPLLLAQTENQKNIPLAVASYPAKGRAIWLFSDTMWRMAMPGDAKISRFAHHQFFQGAINWLLRQDYRKPLLAKDFQVRQTRNEQLAWDVTLRGPAAKYFAASNQWQLLVCGSPVDTSKITISRAGGEDRILTGVLPANIAGGSRCELRVTGEHVAFGSVKAVTAAVVPETFNDEHVGQAPSKLMELERLTSAKLVFADENQATALTQWIEAVTGSEGIALPGRYKSSRDFYWAFRQWWIWLLLGLLPVEVLIRRWHRIFGAASGRTRWWHRRPAASTALK